MNEPSVGGAGGFDDGLGHRGMSVSEEIAQIDEFLRSGAERPR